jgi:hypothetical protein
MKLFVALLVGLSLTLPMKAKANEMRTFLLSCAYGTAIGAAVGLATVAVSDDPGGKSQNIARGASLGLYAGIAMGLYLNYGRESAGSQDFTLQRSPVWIQADAAAGKISGASLHWLSYQF